ncbi:MAG TPA: ribosome maturation factor RimM [bacterium]|nr:ribosome maturation factor RimM [bacterium]
MALINRERLVCIGKVQDAHGLNGELRVKPFTDSPSYYERHAEVILDAGKGLRPHAVRSIRSAGASWLVQLEGVDTREAAMALKGAELLLDESELRPLEEGEYFLDDLIGCTVEDLDGTQLGTVRGVIETGANDVLEVTTEAGETLVPMTAEVVQEVDMAARRIRIAPLPGLFDAES